MTIKVGCVQYEVAPREVDLEFWKRVNAGEWEPYTFTFLRRWLTRSYTYLDVGAWIGSTVLYASKFAGRCLAFEPDPAAFAALRDNLKKSFTDNVKAYEVAVGDTQGPVSLGTSSAWGDSMSAVGCGKNRITVPSVTFGDLLDEFDSPHIFVKMDIEGGEVAALRSMGDRRPTMLLSLHEPFVYTPDDMIFVRGVLGSYRHLYAADGNPTTPDKVGGFDVVLATNEELPE